MKNILITGGAGNIGGSLVRALVKNGSYFVQIVDNLSTGKMDNLPDQNIGNWDFIQCDVNNNSEISSVMRGVKFDVVFHYAAMVGVERTQLNPLGVLKDIEGIKNILNLSKETNVKRVFYASSSEVYGEAVSTYQHEITTPLNSRLPYAIVKNVGESFFRSYGEEHGLKYTIFRFFNTYGPLQNNDFVVSRFINKALNNEDIYIYGDGSQSRTFLHINDNISFTLKVLSDDAFINDIVNVGNDKEVTVKELANIIKDMLNSKSKINYIDPLKEGDMQRRRPDIMKMIEFYKKDLISIEDGISLIMQEWNS
jgi:nucleoside-diphosphate-sugar epimerase